MKFFGKDKPGSNVVIKGVPFESVSFSQGCALAPCFLRYCAESIETKSSYFNKNCENFEDAGDIPCYGIGFNEAIELIEKEAENIFKNNKFGIFIGGDHTITYSVFKSAKKVYPDLKLLILDAHTDFRDEFMGSELNHATWLKKLYEGNLIKKEDVFIFGARENYPEVPFKILNINEIKNLSAKIYLSIDFDVIDPKEFNSVSNPVPMGCSVKDIYCIFEKIYKNLICVDFVEFNPLRGDALTSGTTFAFILRDFLTLLSEKD